MLLDPFAEGTHAHTEFISDDTPRFTAGAGELQRLGSEIGGIFVRVSDLAPSIFILTRRDSRYVKSAEPWQPRYQLTLYWSARTCLSSRVLTVKV